MAGDYATREWPRHQAKTVAEHVRKHRAAKRGKGAALKQSRDKAVTARGKDQSDGKGSDGNGSTG